MSATEPRHQTAQVSVKNTLMQMINSTWVSQSICVAAKIGIADLLKDGSKSNDELALSLNVNADALYRILRALSSLGIFAEMEDRHWKLTPMAEYLQSDFPETLRGMAIMGSVTAYWEAWGNIFYSVKTGKPAFDDINGMPAFEYLAQNPEASAIFNEAMTSVSKVEAAAVVESYDFSEIQTLVDIGGGHGYLLSSILKANPTLKGIVYDLPFVAESATLHQQIAEIQGRCSFASGSFFDKVPLGADAYLMKHIIHDWNDSRCITILKNCHDAITDNGKLLVIETVIPGANEPSIGKLVDIEMLVMTNGGRERTAEEFKELFAQGGFELTNIIPTPSPVCIIEGIKK